MSIFKLKPIKGSSFQIGLYSAIVVFLAYTMIFGFRKSFTVATFDGMEVWGYSYKTLLVLSQMLGYMLAKFYGIKYISEMERHGRWKIIFAMTGIAWLSWLLFAIIPAPWNIAFLFINGFPLGMLWGVVFSYVEGRRTTDFIGATLAVSFIFASGFVKSVGAWLLLEFAISETWVPFFTGLVFALPLALFVALMEKIPEPDQLDRDYRVSRVPMSAEDRKAFIRLFLPGLVAAILIYCFATIFRDIRDNFSAEMWKELGYFDKPAIFTQTETPITLIILAIIGSMVLIKNSFRALMLSHYLIGIGFLFAGISSYLFTIGALSPILWMTAAGLGLYMVYIPFNSVFFDRLIAAFRHTGNVGFLIYLADSFGYLGSIGVLLSKEFFQVKVNWVTFFSNSVILLSIAGLGLTLFSALYFSNRYRKLVPLQS